MSSGLLLCLGRTKHTFISVQPPRKPVAAAVLPCGCTRLQPGSTVATRALMISRICRQVNIRNYRHLLMPTLLGDCNPPTHEGMHTPNTGSQRPTILSHQACKIQRTPRIFC
ncbi:hypothetical protein DUNSADRAFT_15121 [Dunaliella salina]|uniref:Encoded protein n=1 Tax=Dunaliella salina TaxID=3046 RepID=A0ABQ7H232_DUNSA|nr:hypothetical protein DUNSADRAFT_15121 [Dunaliella salina]|eukprot:KAF5840921.1 hypothetical protein DUNSADRAFT_15121 [Dunaliella salina]